MINGFKKQYPADIIRDIPVIKNIGNSIDFNIAESLKSNTINIIDIIIVDIPQIRYSLFLPQTIVIIPQINMNKLVIINNSPPFHSNQLYILLKFKSISLYTIEVSMPLSYDIFMYVHKNVNLIS